MKNALQKSESRLKRKDRTKILTIYQTSKDLDISQKSLISGPQNHSGGKNQFAIANFLYQFQSNGKNQTGLFNPGIQIQKDGADQFSIINIGQNQTNGKTQDLGAGIFQYQSNGLKQESLFTIVQRQTDSIKQTDTVDNLGEQYSLANIVQIQKKGKKQYSSFNLWQFQQKGESQTSLVSLLQRQVISKSQVAGITILPQYQRDGSFQGSLISILGKYARRGKGQASVVTPISIMINSPEAKGQKYTGKNRGDEQLGIFSPLNIAANVKKQTLPFGINFGYNVGSQTGLVNIDMGQKPVWQYGPVNLAFYEKKKENPTVRLTFFTPSFKRFRRKYANAVKNIEGYCFNEPADSKDATAPEVPVSIRAETFERDKAFILQNYKRSFLGRVFGYKSTTDIEYEILKNRPEYLNSWLAHEENKRKNTREVWTLTVKPN